MSRTSNRALLITVLVLSPFIVAIVLLMVMIDAPDGLSVPLHVGGAGLLVIFLGIFCAVVTGLNSMLTHGVLSIGLITTAVASGLVAYRALFDDTSWNDLPLVGTIPALIFGALAFNVGGFGLNILLSLGKSRDTSSLKNPYTKNSGDRHVGTSSGSAPLSNPYLHDSMPTGQQTTHPGPFKES